MSSVYLARHVLIDRLMAIKTLRRDLATDPVQRDRFIREARAVNRINHENIVEITDFGETDDGLVYLVMEYVPGESLLRVMAAGPMPSIRALHIARQSASALGRAHEMGVVHRDLKPENMLLLARHGRPDFVKILDFGIAKILDAPSLTGSQQIFGTPGYIAPEYIQSTNIDGRADLYSLGVILYELVTGALPFDYEYPGDLLVKHVTEPPIPLRERYPSVDPPVEEFVLRCLEKDPDRRFRDSFHFLEELERVAERLGSPRLWGSMAERGAPEASDARRDGGSAWDGAASRGASRDSREARFANTRDDGTRLDPPIEGGKPKIPDEPSFESVADFELPVTAPTGPRPAATPFDPEVDGLVGVGRWRRRHDVLHDLVDRVGARVEVPARVRNALANASEILVRFEECAARASERQVSVEKMDAEARRLRSELGERIETLGGRLSKLRREIQELTQRRAEIVERLEGRSPADGADEALLWELAAVEAELRERDTEASRADRDGVVAREELERRSGHYEQQIAREAQRLGDEMVQMDGMAYELGEPLEVAERFVLEHWTDPEGAPSRVDTPPSGPFT
jgi:serine/threonine-protein kinase